MRRRRQRMVQDLIPGLVDQADLDWGQVERVRYLIRQTFRYEYEAPISQLQHRLMIVPPDRHGDQRTVLSHLRISDEAHEVSQLLDDYGNTVIEVRMPWVAAAVEFEAWIAVDRTSTPAPVQVSDSWLSDARLLEPDGLTEPGRHLRQVARQLATRGLSGLELAGSVSEWVHGALAYRPGLTDIYTPAAEAIRRRGGVCQDHAHVMLALCRQLGLPARYVSGHLLGEGGTHAWVEVLVPQGRGRAAAHGFDPTHGRTTNIRYITVAVGRDYRDVAPTSGTYMGGRGQLSARKRVDIVGFEYI